MRALHWSVIAVVITMICVVLVLSDDAPQVPDVEQASPPSAQPHQAKTQPRQLPIEHEDLAAAGDRAPASRQAKTEWKDAARRHQIQLASCRSPTPRKAANADDPRGLQTIWLGPSGLWLRNKKVAQVVCAAGPCQLDVLRAGDQTFQIDPQALGAPTAQGPRLIPRLRVRRGQILLIVADSAASSIAVMQLIATINQQGATPVIGCANRDALVSLWPDDAPRSAQLRALVVPGEQVPADTEGLTVELTRSDWTAVIQREGGGYLRRQLMKKVPSVIAQWAAKVAGVGARASHLLVASRADVSFADVVSVIDAALCPCSDVDCTTRARRMKTWSMVELRPGQGAGEVDLPTIDPPVVRAKTRLQAPSAPVKIPKGVDAPTLQGHRMELDLRQSLPTAIRRP